MAAQARLSLHMSKCHIVGNHMSRLIYPSLVLVQPRKTCPWLTERLLMGRKESNQTKQTNRVKYLQHNISEEGKDIVVNP